MNPFDLTGKKAIVTGAAQGLSRGMAEGLMEAGAEVTIFDLNPNTEAVAAEFSAKEYKCHGIRVNIGKKEERETAFAAAVKNMGGIDILVNGAGVQRRHKCEEFPLEDWNFVLNINLTSVFALCQLAVREFLKNGGEKIVNVASMLSFFGGFTVPAYAAARAALRRLPKHFQTSLPIRISILTPWLPAIWQPI